MKRLFVCFLSLALLMSLSGCGTDPSPITDVTTRPTEPTTQATEPTTQATEPTLSWNDEWTDQDDPLEETQPTKPQYTEYTGQWLDRSTAQYFDEPVGNTLYITEIYTDCFIACITAPPQEPSYEIKVNGEIYDEWCRGDAVYCTYNNLYIEEETGRQEADLISIEPGELLCYKPVIYLYPKQETDVSVKLNLDGKLTCTYPAYQDGWNVTAAPDGTLTDDQGQTYNYLYWEGKTNARWDLSTGFCIKGEDTAAFLEEALAKLGLNRKEANEFIVYWLPLMEQNPYNIISFQTDRYTDAAPLEVTPAPVTSIRVFMAWSASDSFVELPEQELISPQRTGFTLVEWGGTQVP